MPAVRDYRRAASCRRRTSAAKTSACTRRPPRHGDVVGARRSAPRVGASRTSGAERASRIRRRARAESGVRRNSSPCFFVKALLATVTRARPTRKGHPRRAVLLPAWPCAATVTGSRARCCCSGPGCCAGLAAGAHRADAAEIRLYVERFQDSLPSRHAIAFFAGLPSSSGHRTVRRRRRSSAPPHRAPMALFANPGERVVPG